MAVYNLKPYKYNFLIPILLTHAQIKIAGCCDLMHVYWMYTLVDGMGYVIFSAAMAICMTYGDN